ncbi:MAG TPA: dTDP-4-dehydrorhamnose 3,5-epimerase [Candidatus Binatia bacterium]|jgi:dTDP-4-dehydrorhamnose 3,5-epimerase|nr:dTDP-4-dehydrorhamnose 3,5-epimerase [Candidatus Binatia bacterium]
MPFSFRRTLIPEVILIEPRIFSDLRGFFTETYKRSEFAAQGITEIFVQCNMSRSSKGILRGLHYQKYPKCQSKLVWAVAGEIYDVVVDLRRSSPTFGKWIAQILSAENRKILYVPVGFAHGFCVTSEVAEIVYMATEEYAPAFEAGVLWNDPTLQIDWPIPEPLLSDRDKSWPRLTDADPHFG